MLIYRQPFYGKGEKRKRIGRRHGYTSIWKEVSLVSRAEGVPMLPLEERRTPSLTMSHSASLNSRECERESEKREGGLMRSLKPNDN